MPSPPGLHRLARFHGVQTAYHDNQGRRVSADAETLMAALQALGVPLRGAADIAPLLAIRERELWDRVLDPVVVAWLDDGAGRSNTFALRIPVPARDRTVSAAITFEDGGFLRWPLSAGDLEPAGRATVGGREYVALRAPLPDGLPPGYHDLQLTVGEGRARERFGALLIAAPRRAAHWDAVVGRRGWGLFAPMHALWEDRGGGLRDAASPGFRLLEDLAERVAGYGGTVVGTLPLMASFLDDPYDPSPYAPVSRLFWNELYVELPGGSPGRRPFRSGLFDPRSAMAERRPALEAAAREFFARTGEPEALASFRGRNPAADDYARFRALAARRGPWSAWQDRLRGRDVRETDYDRNVARYHLFAQWLAERQLMAAKERAEARGVGLYLDLPLGVHPDGYDVWRHRELFAVTASAGAPPDPLAAGGQDWGFPPLHPEAGRFDRHRYFIACIRNHLRYARVLRIDHVMQFHRMYWVLGGDPRHGVYVRYPSEEVYAVLCLESRRARSVIVGEDLGTVPRVVREDMRRHGLPGMYVLQFELMDTEEGRALAPRPVRPGALASIGTHDTPTFAGWWRGRDLEIRAELGQMSGPDASAEIEGRSEMRRKLAAGLRTEDQAAQVHAALLRRLGASDAGLVLATMEDLWLEPEPQNVPGTVREENWRRPFSRPIQTLDQPAVAEQLRQLNDSREGKHE
jgi:4-alpha-glucanotransferase